MAGRQKADLIKRWVGPDSLVCGSLRNGAETVYLARGAAKDTRDGLNIFKGYAVDHEGERLIFSGASATPDATAPREGCYFRAQEDADKITIGNDIFAQLPMIYFSGPGLAAVSDSLFVLAELRKHLGLPRKIDNHDGPVLDQQHIGATAQ